MGVAFCGRCGGCNTTTDIYIDELPFSNRQRTKEEFPLILKSNNKFKKIPMCTESEYKQAKKNIKEKIINMGAEIIKNQNILEILEKINPFAKNIKIPQNEIENITIDYIDGPLIKFSNGEFYEGGWDINNKRFGYGTSINEDGNVFIGLWENDYFGKFGAFIQKNGNYYIGQLNNGIAEGKGEMLIKNKMKYNGQFNNDLPNGQGILENIIDNSVYNGNVKNCLKEGYGEIKYVDGTIYIGDFKNDKFDGKGKIIFSNGNKYEGGFINGKMGGEGVFTWLDGRQFFGNFVDNVKQGHGKLIWNENKYYEGNWFNNKLHGEGNFHLNGKIIRGKFRFGKIIMKEDELNGFY